MVYIVIQISLVVCSSGYIMVLWGILETTEAVFRTQDFFLVI